MKSCWRITTVVYFLLIVWSCSPAAVEPAFEEVDTTEEDVAAINALAQATEEAYRAGDVAGALSVFSDDVVAMIPNQPTLVGSQALGQAFEAVFAANTYDLTLSTDEVEVSGDWAFWRGTFSVTITPAEGEPIQDEGKALNILARQQDGSWKIARHIRNSDLPLPGAESQ